jgi:hypothetical protein
MKRLHAVPLIAALAVVTAPTLAHADSTIRQPGQHPDYHVDIEPHGVLGFAWWDYGPYYGGIGPGFGGGARFSIPLCKNCFIPKINNNVAISFGADFVLFPFNNANYVFTDLYLPVAMQWNFFVHKKWSVGPEFGLAPVFGVFYNYNYCGGPGCHNWWIYPDFGAVARYHFSDKVALTMRIGFPEFFNIGVSFWL